MAIFTEEIEQKMFMQYEETRNWAKESKENLIRVPVSKFLRNGASFYDDEYFGDEDYLVRFNDHGFRGFCSLLGIRQDTLRIIETPKLSSLILNDLIRQEEIKNKFERLEFVIDKKQRIVLGIVNDSYVGYSNDSFLNDIDNLPLNKNHSFSQAFTVNTELTIVFKSTEIHGEIRGRGGEGVDKSEIGLAFKNSMVGTSSVNINYHLYRLACNNGMMVPAAESVNRIYHSGDINNFKKRLEYSFLEVHRKLNMIKELLIELGNLEFIPYEIAKDRYLSNCIFDLIPGTKQAMCDSYNLYLNYPKGSSKKQKRDIQIEHDGFLIGKIPEFYKGEFSARIFDSQWRSNLSIFDFLNIFTEQAKSKPLYQKVSIEEKTGVLAKYIKENAKKFN